MRDRLLLDGKIGPWRYDPDAELYYFSSELNLGHPGSGSAVPVPLLQLLQHPDDKDRDTEISRKHHARRRRCQRGNALSRRRRKLDPSQRALSLRSTDAERPL